MRKRAHTSAFMHSWAAGATRRTTTSARRQPISSHISRAGVGASAPLRSAEGYCQRERLLPTRLPKERSQPMAGQSRSRAGSTTATTVRGAARTLQKTSRDSRQAHHLNKDDIGQGDRKGLSLKPKRRDQGARMTVAAAHQRVLSSSMTWSRASRSSASQRNHSPAGAPAARNAARGPKPPTSALAARGKSSSDLRPG